jgi:hypothetical protein
VGDANDTGVLPEETPRPVSRREFVRGSAAGLGAGLMWSTPAIHTVRLTGNAGSPSPTTDTTTDVAQVFNRVKGTGYCSTQAHSRFNFDVRRTSGALAGSFHTQVGDASTQFQGQDVRSLTITGNQAKFSVEGKIDGAQPSDDTTYTADVIVLGEPDTFSVTVRAGANVIYTVTSCNVEAVGEITFAPSN